MPIIGELLCLFNVHDWRYASRYSKKGFESRAFCQRCGVRKWEKVSEKASK